MNDEAFPEFERFNEEMREQNIHLVPIIDAGVKQEEGYSVYEEGLEKVISARRRMELLLWRQCGRGRLCFRIC